MVWMEKSVVSQRQEFVLLAQQEGANVRALCRQFGISPKTGYKWINRQVAAGEQPALQDRSRRPLNSPSRSAAAVEQAVVDLRHRHPAWWQKDGAANMRNRNVMRQPALQASVRNRSQTQSTS